MIIEFKLKYNIRICFTKFWKCKLNLYKININQQTNAIPRAIKNIRCTSEKTRECIMCRLQL